MSVYDQPPMDLLADELADAEVALRRAMHAIHDIAAADATPADWYARLGQLETLTRRLGDLTDKTTILIRRMPTGDLYATGRRDIDRTVEAVADNLLDASRLMRAANRDVNHAWSLTGTLGVRDAEGGTS